MTVSILTGFTYGYIEYTHVRRAGDTQEKVDSVNANIATTPITIATNTFVLRDLAHSESPPEGKKLYRIQGPDKKQFFIEGPTGAGDAELTQMANVLYKSDRKTVSSIEAAWTQMKVKWQDLLLENQATARARALQHFEMKPDDVLEIEWSLRSSTAQQPWRIESDENYKQRKLYSSAKAAVVGMFVCAAIVFCLGLLWNSILDRIKELRHSVRKE